MKENITTKLPPMGLTPILSVHKAIQALAYYEKAFDAKEIARIPAPDQQRLLHLRIQIFDTVFIVMDEFPELTGKESRFSSPASLGGTSVTLHLQVADAVKVWNQAMEAGAQSVIPMAKQFWGELYGRIKDPFGHEWTIAQMLEQLSDEAVASAAQGLL